MINAAEARIVTNENIEKAIEREKIKAQKEIERKQAIANELNKIVYTPICEKIAARAAQGYSYVLLTIGDSTYNTNLDIDSTRYYWLGSKSATYNNTKNLVSHIHEYFSALGYTVRNAFIHSVDKGYHDRYTISITW